ENRNMFHASVQIQIDRAFVRKRFPLETLASRPLSFTKSAGCVTSWRLATATVEWPESDERGPGTTSYWPLSAGAGADARMYGIVLGWKFDSVTCVAKIGTSIFARWPPVEYSCHVNASALPETSEESFSKFYVSGSAKVLSPAVRARFDHFLVCCQQEPDETDS
ncbi:hypothetical protein BaRGS_00036812, partial [Batillaria attramentaria]